MSKRVYSDETKAAVMAALLAGQSVSSASKEYNIPEGTIKAWASREIRSEVVASVATTKKEEIGDLLVEYLRANLQALKAQAVLFSESEWLRKQTAESAAVLHGVMTDKAVRLIEAVGQHGGEQVPNTDAEP